MIRVRSTYYHGEATILRMQSNLAFNDDSCISDDAYSMDGVLSTVVELDRFDVHTGF